MFKLIKTIQLFFLYRKNIKKNKSYLLSKYGLEYNKLYELYTTIILSDAPSEMKQKYGDALASYEIKKYITNLMKDLEKLDLDELINIYEIKRINDDLYGIAFGFTQMKNRKMYLMLLSMIIGLLALITFGIFIIL